MSSPGGSASKGGPPKKKGTTLPLTSFLKPEMSSWADDDPENETLPPLPTAPGGPPAGLTTYGNPGPTPEPELPKPRLPTRPPYKIFVGNLPYDTTPQELGEYFHDPYTVKDVHLLRHHDTGNVKGAFVEFETVQDLQGALTHNGQFLRDRPMRVDVATDKPDRGFDRGGHGRRSFEDDRRGGYQERGGFRDRGGYEDSKFGHGDRSYGRTGFGDRGGYTERVPHGYPESDHHDRRGPPGGFDRRPRDYGGSESEADSQRWGSRAPPPPPQQPGSEPAGPPVERKRLVLAPRTKPLEADAPQPEEGAGEKPRKANPFGSARPNDASARLKALEERLAKEKEQAVAARNAERERSQAAASAAEAAASPAGPAEAVAEASASGRGPPPPASPEQGNGRQGLAPGLDHGRGRGGRRGGRRGGGRGRYGEEGRGRGGARGEAPPAHATRAAPPPPAPGRQPAGGAAEPGFQGAGERRGRGGRTRGWETHTPAQPGKQSEPSQGERQGEEGAVSKVVNMFDVLGTED